MAFFETACRKDGSNLNAGTLDGSSTEVDAAPFKTYANGNWVNGTRVFTVASGDPVADGVTTDMYVSVFPNAATQAVFIGKVTARTNTTITVSGTLKVGTSPATDASGPPGATTLIVGGAWAGVSAALGFPLNFITSTISASLVRINDKDDQTHNITASIVPIISTGTNAIVWQGYTTTYGDGGRFIVDGGTAGVSYVLLNNSNVTYLDVRDAIFKNNGATGSAAGISTAWIARFERVSVQSVRGDGIIISLGPSVLIEVEATICNQSNTVSKAGIQIAARAYLYRCLSHHNAGSNSDGYRCVGEVSLTRCVAAANGKNGMELTGSSSTYIVSHPTCYANAVDGIKLGATLGYVYMENGISEANVGNGLSAAGSDFTLQVRNFAYFGNGTETSGVFGDEGTITGTASLMVDPANGDFAPTGEAIAAGVGDFPQSDGYTGGSVGQPDCGAVQGGHPNTAGLESLNEILRRVSELETETRLLSVRKA